MNKRIFYFRLILELLAAPALFAQVPSPATQLKTRAQLAPVRPYLMAQLGRSGDMFSVKSSPDGRFIVTSEAGGTLACLWDAATGRQVRRFVSPVANLVGAVFSPNGRFILTGGISVCLWDVATGQLIRQFPTGSNEVSFSLDGRFVLTCDRDPIARMWNVATGKLERQFIGHTKMMDSAKFSPDGRFVLTGSFDNTARLWDSASGKEIRQLKGHSDGVLFVAFSPDSRLAATSSADKTTRLWDVATGKEKRRFGDQPGSLNIIFSPDGRCLLMSDKDNNVGMWEVQTGKLVRNFTGHSSFVYGLDFTPRGLLLTASWDGTARLWDPATGKEIRRFAGHADPVTGVAVSPDGRTFATGGKDGIVRVWNGQTGKQQKMLGAEGSDVKTIAYSPDGRNLLVVRWGSMRLWDTANGALARQYEPAIDVDYSRNGQYILGGEDTRIGTDKFGLGVLQWDAVLHDSATGKELKRFELHAQGISSVALSPDGHYALTSSTDRSDPPKYTISQWDTKSGKEVRQFTGHSEVQTFSPDSRFALTALYMNAVLWDVTSGQQMRSLTGHSEPISSMAFSPDGRLAITGSWDKTARLWDMATGKEIRRFEGHSAAVKSVAFSPDGRFVWTGSYDSTARLWDAATGKELCSVISFNDGGWAVTDREGRYDASDPDNLSGLCWVANNEPIDLWQLKARYYDPGLLAKVMGFTKEPLRNVQAFTSVKFYPSFTLIAPRSGSTKMSIALTNRDGGIGPVQVWINGKEFMADARGPKPDVNASKADLVLDLAHAPGLIPGHPNTIRVTARNGEGYLQSRGLELVWNAPGKTTVTARPELYAIVAGIGEYGSPNLHLNLPARDAAKMAAAITVGAKRLFGTDKVHLTLLSSDPNAPNAALPTKANFRRAFEAIKKQAKPDSILVVYLAGHGVALQDAYYYLTAEALSFDLSDPEVRRGCSLSDSELAAWTTGIAALKQVMILDTCAAGSAAHKLAEKRDISGDQIRAIDRLKDRTGFYVLMGCASDAVSYEASQYGQGLLTYALLSGMQGEKLRDGQFVDVNLLFEYAADRVPKLAEGIGGIQRPQILTPTTHNALRDKQQAAFDIGQLTNDDKQTIVLPQPRPRILRFTLQSEDRIKDYLELGAALRKTLREQSDGEARGRSALLYLDIDPEDLPGAILLNGRYTVEADSVKVNLILSQGGVDTKITVTGSKSDIPGLAVELAAAISNGVAGKQPL